MHRSLALFFILSVFTCINPLFAQTDTVLYQRDSVIELEKDCTTGFFQRAEPLDPAGKTIIVNKAGKPMSLKSFINANHIGMASEYGLEDLDGDGKKELLVTNFTNGAHCCDEIYIFKNTAPNKFQHVVTLNAGNTCISDSNYFIYDFYERFGYFFTCFACSYEDNSDTAPIPTGHITLKYSKGKMVMVARDKELKSRIHDNLAKLGEQPYEKLADEISQDNGLRKEFALNLAVYYYSFGKNLAETQRVFNKYYKYPDSKKVWAEFVKILQVIKKTNDF